MIDFSVFILKCHWNLIVVKLNHFEEYEHVKNSFSAITMYTYIRKCENDKIK
jgi:hypothetical protein